MRILQVGKFYHPSKGGIETVLRSLSEGLQQAGDEVEVLCFADRRPAGREQIAGVQVERLASYGQLLSQPLCPGLGRSLREAARRADLVHVHSPNPLAELQGLRLPDEVPLVCTYHADIQRQRLLKPAYRGLQRRFLSRCQRVVAASEEHFMYSPTLANHRDRAAVIPFGLEPEATRLGETGQRLAQRLRRHYGAYVLFVGRLVGYKGLPVLIEAMRELPQQLLIVGEGPLEGRLERQIHRAGLGDRVHLCGRIPDDEELRAYIAGCRVFALPSLTPAEAFGMVLLEAMAQGKPLVSSDLASGVRYVNAHGEHGLRVPPGEVPALRDALAMFLDNEELAERFGSAGRRRFDAEFGTAQMIKAHRRLYAEVLATAPCHTP